MKALTKNPVVTSVFIVLAIAVLYSWWTGGSIYSILTGNVVNGDAYAAKTSTGSAASSVSSAWNPLSGDE